MAVRNNKHSQTKVNKMKHMELIPIMKKTLI